MGPLSNYTFTNTQISLVRKGLWLQTGFMLLLDCIRRGTWQVLRGKAVLLHSVDRD